MHDRKEARVLKIGQLPFDIIGKEPPNARVASDHRWRRLGRVDGGDFASQHQIDGAASAANALDAQAFGDVERNIFIALHHPREIAMVDPMKVAQDAVDPDIAGGLQVGAAYPLANEVGG